MIFSKQFDLPISKYQLLLNCRFHPAADGFRNDAEEAGRDAVPYSGALRERLSANDPQLHGVQRAAHNVLQSRH